MQEKTNLSERSGFAKAVDCVIALLCLAVSLFHIFIAVNSSISVVQQRVIHVMAILLIFFAGQVSETVSKSKWKTIVNSLLFLLTVCVAVYFIKGNTLSALLPAARRARHQSIGHGLWRDFDCDGVVRQLPNCWFGADRSLGHFSGVCVLWPLYAGFDCA